MSRRKSRHVRGVRVGPHFGRTSEQRRRLAEIREWDSYEALLTAPSASSPPTPSPAPRPTPRS